MQGSYIQIAVIVTNRISICTYITMKILNKAIRIWINVSLIVDKIYVYTTEDSIVQLIRNVT